MTPGYAVNVGALLGCVVLLAVAAGTLLMRSGADRRRPAFLTAWARFCWCAATAAALYMLRGTAPDLLVIAVGNSALMLAWSLLWFGARLLRGAGSRPPPSSRSRSFGWSPALSRCSAPPSFFARCRFSSC
jgi:hypothetical protein